MKLIFIVFLGLVSVLAAACGGDEPRLLTPTPTPTQAPPTATPTPTVPSYTVSGVVLDSSNNLLLGGLVTLEPSGKSAVTSEDDGSYVITGVPDGEYVVNVTPKCVAHGCYEFPFLIVDGGDVLEFHLAPAPASVLPGGPPAARSVLDGSINLDQVEFPGDNLVLIVPNDMQAGETAQIVLAAPECFRCAGLLAVDAPVEWSVGPGSSAVIDPNTGLLSIDAAISAGARFTVVAEVGDGQYSLSAEVTIYSPTENPFVGVWRETNTGNVNQLLLTSGREFAVTLNPFEHYQDYWGTYTFDLATGFIEFTATGANQVSPDSEGTGTFVIDVNERLVLEGICFGTWNYQTKTPAANCGHEFEK